MKTLKGFLNRVCFVAMLLAMTFALPKEDVMAQTSVTVTSSTPTVNGCQVYEFTVNFSSDSLLVAKTNLINILPYADYLATITFKATAGTVKNFTINSYLSNFNSSDTSLWTLSQIWDTTGTYTAKPINDTITNKWNGLPMRYAAFTCTGKVGNRKDCVVKGSIVLYRKP